MINDIEFEESSRMGKKDILVQCIESEWEFFRKVRKKLTILYFAK